MFDADTGAYKRMWGAYGNKPEDTNFGRYNPNAPPLQQFRNPVHCSEIAKDGLVYVCDRTNDRIQVFHKDGTFVKEAFVQKTTLAVGIGVGHRVLEGSAAEVHLSRRRLGREGLHPAARDARGA